MSRSKSKIFMLAAGYCLLYVLSGCGYTTRSLIADKFNTIYVEPFVNKIDITQEIAANEKYKVYRPLLESEITRAVSNKFLFDGTLKPAVKENAGLILKG